MSQPRDQAEQDAIAQRCRSLRSVPALRPRLRRRRPRRRAAIRLRNVRTGEDLKFTQSPAKAGSERVLSQEEIDGLLGFSLSDVSLNDNSGIRAIIDSAMVSYERLPMLEIVFDRLVRLMTHEPSELHLG